MIQNERDVSTKIYRNAGNDFVLQLVPDAAQSVLDIGCGAGDNARRLHRQDRVIDGITLSEMEAESARQYCRNVLLHNLEDGLPSELDKSYDVILCSHVIEHICFPEKLLKDAKRVLNVNGFLIVALPNIFWWKTRIPLIIGRFEYMPSGIMDETHFRWYSFRSAQKLLVKNGFDVVAASVEGHFPLGFLRKYCPKSILSKMDRSSCRMFPALFGNQMVFLARKQ